MLAYHICYGKEWRRRLLANDTSAIALAHRLYSFGKRKYNPPSGSLAATIPYEVRVYRDTIVNGAWQCLVKPPIEICIIDKFTGTANECPECLDVHGKMDCKARD